MTELFSHFVWAFIGAVVMTASVGMLYGIYATTKSWSNEQMSRNRQFGIMSLIFIVTGIIGVIVFIHNTGAIFDEISRSVNEPREYPFD